MNSIEFHLLSSYIALKGNKWHKRQQMVQKTVFTYFKHDITKWLHPESQIWRKRNMLHTENT